MFLLPDVNTLAVSSPIQILYVPTCFEFVDASPDSYPICILLCAVVPNQ